MADGVEVTGLVAAIVFQCVHEAVPRDLTTAMQISFHAELLSIY
jgi:hypothetical protein